MKMSWKLQQCQGKSQTQLVAKYRQWHSLLFNTWNNRFWNSDLGTYVPPPPTPQKKASMSLTVPSTSKSYKQNSLRKINTKTAYTVADLGGGCRGQGVRTPWDDLRFSNTTGILQKKKKLCGLLVLKESKRRVHPLLKKIQDLPPVIFRLLCKVLLYQNTSLIGYNL